MGFALCITPRLENGTIKACGYFVVVACLLYLHYPFKIHRDNLAGEKKRWVRVKRSEVAKVHYLCQVKPFMLLVQYIQLLGCFHFFKTAAVCSGDIEITL